MADNIAQLICDAWEQAERESPDPLRIPWFEDLLFGRRRSYRDRLDAQPVNCYGESIPRIVTVRWNLRRLGPIRLDPARLR